MEHGTTIVPEDEVHETAAEAADAIEENKVGTRSLRPTLRHRLYLVHLSVLLWRLLDKSSNQRATTALVSLTQQLLPCAAVAFRVAPVRRFAISVDELIRESLFGGR